jgi:lysophospholipase L1-like esterase
MTYAWPFSTSARTSALAAAGRSFAAAVTCSFLVGLSGCTEDPEEPGNAPLAQVPVTFDAQTALPEAGLGVSDAGVWTIDAATLPMPGLDAQVGPGVTVGKDAGSGPPMAADAGSVADASSVDAGSTDASGPRTDQGKGNGKDVITIGDSWMLLVFSGIQESLVKVAMQPYRKYGFAGTQVLTGDIPAQFDRAKSEDANIKTVVMTGGGNDILLSGAGADCETGGPNCTAQLDKVATTLDKLWKKMADSGVQDVVHVQYAAIAVKNNPVKNLPAHLVRLQELCSSHPPMRCFQLNTDAIVTELRADGIHPTDANYDKLGKAVFDLMVKEGMRR